ncbi:uncharacterized protein ACRADG_010678 [Cochliomyia hominivorax]
MKFDLPTFCIGIGIFSGVVYIICAIFSLVRLDIMSMIINLVMVLISGLLIMGIQKRRDMLMLPWIVLTVIGAIPVCIKLIIDKISDLINGVPGETVLCVLVGSVIGIALLLWPVIHLFRKIRNETMNRGGPK